MSHLKSGPPPGTTPSSGPSQGGRTRVSAGLVFSQLRGCSIAMPTACNAARAYSAVAPALCILTGSSIRRAVAEAEVQTHGGHVPRRHRCRHCLQSGRRPWSQAHRHTDVMTRYSRLRLDRSRCMPTRCCATPTLRPSFAGSSPALGADP